MECLFVKNTVQRKEKFQIITTINRRDSGELFVRKSAYSNCADKHIADIYRNYVLLKEDQSLFKLPESSYDQKFFDSAFVDGKTMEDMLAEFIYEGDRKNFLKVFTEYVDLLRQLESITCNPYDNSEFADIFTTLPSGLSCEYKCLTKGMIDFIPENLIVNEDGIYHIDFEWLIKAPLPQDFIIYRALVVLHNKYHLKLHQLISLEELFDLFEISDNISVFKQWENEFSSYVHDNLDYHDNYLIKTNSYADWQNNSPAVVLSTLYYDTEGYFSEEQSIKKDIRPDFKNKFVYDLPQASDLKYLRWDPCENYALSMENVEISCFFKGELCYQSDHFETNGLHRKALNLPVSVLILNHDPQIIFDFGQIIKTDRIIIRADIRLLSYNEIISRASELISEYNTYNKSSLTYYSDFDRDGSYSMNRLQKSIDHMLETSLRKQNELNLLRHSYGNRLTNPLRKLRHLLRELRKPLSNLEQLDLQIMNDSINKKTEGVFEITGEDPQLQAGRKFRKGLYLLRWEGQADSRMMVKLFPDYGNGISELNSIRLGYIDTNRSLKERFVLFKSDVNLLRIDPGEQDNNFLFLNSFLFVRLGLFTAVRVGIDLIHKQTGFSKIGLLRHMVKLVLTGKKSEAKQHFVNAFNSFGDGKAVFENDEAAYQQYIKNCEPSAEVLNQQTNQAESFAYKPLISILVPVYNTDETMLREMIDSVIKQTYTNWQLCLADGKSALAHVKNILAEYAEKDNRISCVYMEDNLGIVGNTNAALELAKGDFVGLLDHDDLLTPWALYEVVKAINSADNVDMIYSDEDKIASDGSSRFQPHFKPDWSPDLLRSYNYITHLFVARKSIIDNLGGFRNGYDGSQDHDLILRVSEVARNIVHIPMILYHWRSHAASTAENPASKTYTLKAGAKAIKDHLDRSGLSGTVSFDDKIGIYSVDYKLTVMPKVSIIIPNYEHKTDLQKCLESITGKSSYDNYEIIIVENNSSSEEIFAYYRQIEKDSRIKVIKWEREFNYSAINNFAVKAASGEQLLFLNNDTEVIAADWIEQFLQYAQRDDVGCVGAKLYYTNGSIQHAGVVLGFQGIAAHSFCQLPGEYSGYMNRAIVAQNVTAVTAACMMIKRTVFEEIGGFDETLAVAFNDIDLCMKVRSLGKLIVLNPKVELYHHESLSRGFEDTPEKQKRFASEIEHFKQKWQEQLAAGDPYYNPHLDLELMPFRVSGD